MRYFIFLYALIAFLSLDINNAKAIGNDNGNGNGNGNGKNNNNRNKNKHLEKWNSNKLVSSDILLRDTTYGPVLGTRQTNENGDDVLIWYNIPYGAAPVGELRWKAPQDPEPWTTALNCTVPGEIALQISDDKVVGTEDCLNLDVYTVPGARKLPVMVYIHGGNNQTGHSREVVGDEIVVKDDCIYISLNYRLGIFGFNALPALHTEAGSSGNYALLDMAKALDWIKENAEAFGGDPNNITITGFSAGGRDVMAMLISPLFANKFRKAIVFSGGMTIANMEDSIKRTAAVLAPLAVADKVAENEEKAKAWLMTDGEDVKDWIYSVSSDRLCNLMGNAGIRMSVFPHLFNDGVVIPKEGFETTQWNNVPIIMYTSSTEFSFFNFGAYIWYVPGLFESDAALEAARTFAVINGSDMYRIFNAQRSAEQMYDKYQSQIFVGQIDFGSVNSQYEIPGVGSFHGVFIPMLTKNHTYGEMYDFSNEAYQAMGEVFNSQIKRFLKNGNPSGPGLPSWKKWNPSRPVSMILDAADGEAIAECRDVTTTYDEIMERMDKDTTVSEKDKTLVIQNSLNGRWFSEALDEHYNNQKLRE